MLNYHCRGGNPVRGCIGWYHSHPGYTCFLSGIDVNTQQLSQQAEGPWVAVVLDPVRTITRGRIDIKAFRTYPEQHAHENALQTLSSATVKEYGIHAHRYYELPITIGRSESDAKHLDALLGQYWALSFTANPLLANVHFITRQIEWTAAAVRRTGGGEAVALRPFVSHSTVEKRPAAARASASQDRDWVGTPAEGLYDTKICSGKSNSVTVASRELKGTGRLLNEDAGRRTRDDSGADPTGSHDSAQEAELVRHAALVAAEVLQGGVQLAVKNAIFSPMPIMLGALRRPMGAPIGNEEV